MTLEYSPSLLTNLAIVKVIRTYRSYRVTLQETKHQVFCVGKQIDMISIIDSKHANYTRQDHCVIENN